MNSENLNVNIIYPDGSHKYLINKRFNDILDRIPIPAPNKILVRGLPGSGKSTFAKKLARVEELFHVEADMFHVYDGEYRFDPRRLGEAHQWCYNTYRILHRVVVSNTFVDFKSFKVHNLPEAPGHYILDYNPKPMIITCFNEFGNIHAVPEKTLKSMENRFVTPGDIVEEFYGN